MRQQKDSYGVDPIHAGYGPKDYTAVQRAVKIREHSIVRENPKNKLCGACKAAPRMRNRGLDGASQETGARKPRRKGWRSIDLYGQQPSGLHVFQRAPRDYKRGDFNQKGRTRTGKGCTNTAGGNQGRRVDRKHLEMHLKSAKDTETTAGHTKGNKALM